MAGGRVSQGMSLERKSLACFQDALLTAWVQGERSQLPAAAPTPAVSCLPSWILTSRDCEPK